MTKGQYTQSEKVFTLLREDKAVCVCVAGMVIKTLNFGGRKNLV